MALRNSAVSKKKFIDEENPYWISFSDIMACLLLIFMMAVVVLIIKLHEMREDVLQDLHEIHKANQVRQEIINDIKDELEKKGIIVNVSDNKTIIRIPDQILSFTSNKYDIENKYSEILKEVGEVLYQSILKEDRKRYIDTIFIEGHTDSLPANLLHMGNWGLSSDRAISVWKYWTEQIEIGVQNNLPMSELRNSAGEYMFSVSGYAATRRIVEIDDDADKRRRNRRIDIRFTMKQPTSSDYERTLKTMDF